MITAKSGQKYIVKSLLVKTYFNSLVLDPHFWISQIFAIQIPSSSSNPSDATGTVETLS